MDLVTYALVTLENTKTFLGITDNKKDEKLKMMINMATDYIASQTGRKFTSIVHTLEEYDGTGTDQLNLKGFPIITPPEVFLWVNNNVDNSDNWTLIDSKNYWVDYETGIITRTSDFLDFDDGVDGEETLSETIFQKGKYKYRVTYTSGYSVIPYDLQFACMTLVSQLMNTSTGGGIKSESLGDHSITYQDITEITGGGGGILNDILSKYRDIPIV